MPIINIIRTNEIIPGEISALGMIQTCSPFHVQVVNWINEKQAMNMIEVDVNESIFVLRSFSGKAFEHLQSLHAKIMSIQQILLLVKSGDFDFSRHFIGQNILYSQAMTGLVICCSGIDSKEKKKEIYSKIKMMNGKVSQVLDEEVTHLIVSKRVGSEKYYAASQSKIPIMLPEWIDAIWENSDELQNPKYKCPLFYGLIFCCTGVNKKEKTELTKKIEANGGIFKDIMTKDITTHLIINETKLQGEKYNRAKEWKIEIVNIKWLNKSIETGCCLTICSDQSQIERLSIMNTMDTSEFILPTQQETIQEDNSQLTQGENFQHKNIFSGKSFRLIEFDSDKIKQIEMEVAENEATIDNERFDYCLYPITVSVKPENQVKARTLYWMRKCLDENILFEKEDCAFFQPIVIDQNKKPLQNCVICLSEFMKHTDELLKEICLLLGAYVHPNLVLEIRNPNSSKHKLTTHLIRATSDFGIKYEYAKKYGVPVVNFKWILAAAIFGEKQSENEYAL